MTRSTSGSPSPGHTQNHVCCLSLAAKVLWELQEADGVGVDTVWNWSLQGHPGRTLGSSPVHRTVSTDFQERRSAKFSQRHFPAHHFISTALPLTRPSSPVTRTSLIASPSACLPDAKFVPPSPTTMLFYNDLPEARLFPVLAHV